MVRGVMAIGAGLACSDAGGGDSSRNGRGRRRQDLGAGLPVTGRRAGVPPLLDPVDDAVAAVVPHPFHGAFPNRCVAWGAQIPDIRIRDRQGQEEQHEHCTLPTTMSRRPPCTRSTSMPSAIALPRRLGDGSNDLVVVVGCFQNRAGL